MTDHAQEQEMEIEALQAILMDEIKEIDHSESGLSSTSRCFQITLSPQASALLHELFYRQASKSCLERGGGGDLSTIGLIPLIVLESLCGQGRVQDDDLDASNYTPVQLALIFSHTEKYPDEPPLLNVKSIRGIKTDDLKMLQYKLGEEASENLGMAMVYTLATSAKEWLHEKYGQNVSDEVIEESTAKDDIIVPHGEPVTVETFVAWRERFEAELALERAKLMPESALTAPKEKKLTGRQWFESGRASLVKGSATIADESEEEEEDIDFDDDFEDDEEEDMLEHYLAQKSEK